MVSRETNESKTVEKKTFSQRLKLGISLVLLGLATTFLAFVICFIIGDNFYHGKILTSKEEPSESEIESESIDETPTQEFREINFQPVVDDFVNSVGGNKSVLVYDLERDELVGKYDSTREYNTASLYKLFVVYEGYRRLENHTWKANEMAASTGYTILKCLDLAIRESNSPCAETLLTIIGRSELNNVIQNDFGILHTDVSRFTSTPEDILEIMKLFYYHKDITNESLLSTMKDSFLNQPATTYNWRQGLPSGFNYAKVYNKVGWDFNVKKKIWNIYHDTAIVEFPEENRHFAIVVMTNNIPYQKIKQFGSAFENYYLENR